MKPIDYVVYLTKDLNRSRSDNFKQSNELRKTIKN